MSTGPIDVKTTSNKCDVECNFTFNYKNSSLRAINKRDYIKLTYDNSRDQEITFSGTKYDVEEIRIYSSSLNKYQGRFYPCEMIIHHGSNDGSNLLVCVPIVVNNNLSSSHTLFRSIVRHFPRKRNEEASINERNYNLNHIIPRGGYYSYNGKLPYEPYTGNYDIILFDPAIAPNMNRNDYNILRKIIRNISSNEKIKEINDEEYFYNPSGTLNEELINDDKIYIKCNPVDQDGNLLEEIDTKRKGDGMNFFKLDFDNEANTKQLLTIGGSMVFAIGLIIGIYTFRRYLKNID